MMLWSCCEIQPGSIDDNQVVRPGCDEQHCYVVALAHPPRLMMMMMMMQEEQKKQVVVVVLGFYRL